MSNSYIYNAVYRNATKKAIYREVIDYVNKVVLLRVQKILDAQEKYNAKQAKEREKSFKVALDWEREKTAKEIKKVLKTLKRPNDRLYTTIAHNNAIDLALRSIKL